MNKILHLVLLVIIVACSSCISNKNLLYLQENTFSTDSLTVFHNQQAQYLIQPNDVLFIKVKGLDPAATEFLNLEGTNRVNQINPGALFINGFSVNDSGFVHLPVIGPVMIGGLNVTQARDTIQKKVDLYLTEGTAIVNIVSFKISVLGEVRTPSTFYVYKTQFNVFEALAQVGGLNEFANRKEVNLVRQTATGSEATLIDLTDPNLMESPNYYLRPNDVLYIQPLKQRSSRSNLANLSVFSVTFSGISTIIAIILLIDNLNQD